MKENKTTKKSSSKKSSAEKNSYLNRKRRVSFVTDEIKSFNLFKL
jgi:hypothetical protein